MYRLNFVVGFAYVWMWAGGFINMLVIASELFVLIFPSIENLWGKNCLDVTYKLLFLKNAVRINCWSHIGFSTYKELVSWT